MKTEISFFQLLSIIISFVASTAAYGQPRSVSDATNVVAYYEDSMGLPTGEPTLRFALWPDEFAVWRAYNGGAPEYRTAKLPAGAYTKFVDQIEKLGFFDLPELSQQTVGADARFTVLMVNRKGRRLKMQSWHELYESNGMTHMMSGGGIAPLEGKSLLSQLQQEDAKYIFYHYAWLQLRSDILELRPPESRVIEGKFELDRKSMQLIWKTD